MHFRTGKLNDGDPARGLSRSCRLVYVSSEWFPVVATIEARSLLAGAMRAGPLVYYFTLVWRLVSLAAPSGTTERLPVAMGWWGFSSVDVRFLGGVER